MAAVLVLLVSILLALFLPSQRVLAISEIPAKTARGGNLKTIYSRDALGGFCVSYTHSVNKARVRDHYRVNNGDLELWKTEFKNYGAGMPEKSDTPNSIFRIDGDSFSMEEERRIGRKMLLAVGVVAEHSITIGEEEFFLKEFFEPRASLEFSVKKISAARLKISGNNKKLEVHK